MLNSLHARIASALRDQIVSGELRVGDTLPSEAQLGVAWNASRGPVRHALATLKTEGFVESAQGRATTVRSRQLTQRVDTFLPFSRWAKEFGRTPSGNTIEISRRRASTEAAQALHIERGEPVIELVRLRLLDGVPTMLEHSTFIERVGRQLFDFGLDDGSITDFLRERGVTYHAVIQVLDAVAADAQDASLLGVELGGPLLRQRRTASDVDGTIFEYSDDRYRPDLVTFSVAYLRPEFTRG